MLTGSHLHLPTTFFPLQSVPLLEKPCDPFVGHDLPVENHQSRDWAYNLQVKSVSH